VRNVEYNQIPLRILICDLSQSAASTLKEALSHFETVTQVDIVETFEDARSKLRVDDINTIFIDPIAYGIEQASDFIFGIRKTLPEIVFVLYVDKAQAERQRSVFYRGERRRFSHYYSLDKRTPIGQVRDEVRSVIDMCQSDLSWRMSTTSLKRLIQQTESPTEGPSEYGELIKELRRIVPITPGQETERRLVKKSVFLSYRFAESEYVGGFTKLLEQNGFSVATGRSSNTYVSRAILDRIRQCEFFVCIMTKDKRKEDGTYTTSPWLLEEKGAALAFGKQIVLMVEEGVSDIGGLQGDWQRIHFGPKGFLNAALEAVKQLRSYVGES
jgi:hypothetical protein